jgi:TolB protein
VIAFTARDERGAFDIFTVDTSGFVERLTQNQGSNEDPSFSPDGNYIVFTSSRSGSGPRIYIMTADGEVQTLITRNGSGYGSPAWSR